jgi:hypothetical protein
MHTATITQHREAIHTQGFTVIANVFDESAVNAMITAINTTDSSGPLFRKTKDLFAIRRFLQVVPAISSCSRIWAMDGKARPIRRTATTGHTGKQFYNPYSPG